jgi:4-hydroxy-3-polyprenylbenzoate decarboxylase
MRRLIIGMSGASGVVYGVRLLEVLKNSDVEPHLIMSKNAVNTLKQETEFTEDYVKNLATAVYDNNDLSAPPSSGSFRTIGMVVIPCSMKTLAAIATGLSDNLITRAASVTLKERRKLVLVVRETPLSTIHIENMLKASIAGGIILPAMPGFYNRPETIDDLINHIVGRVLDMFEIEHKLFKRWGEDGLNSK